MPYQFILAAPYVRNGSNTVEYYSDHADRGDVPNIVNDDQRRAKRFDSQEEAAKYVGHFMRAKEHMQDVINASLGRIVSELTKRQDYSPIHIVPIE
jgi:hypothetical protein